MGMSHKRQIDHGDKDETPKQPSPYKKARYHWEIKKSRRQSCSSNINGKTDNEIKESSSSLKNVALDDVFATNCKRDAGLTDSSDLENHMPNEAVCGNDSDRIHNEVSSQTSDTSVFPQTSSSPISDHSLNKTRDANDLDENSEIRNSSYISEPDSFDSESREHSIDAVSETLEDLTEYFPLPVGNSQDNSPNIEYQRWQNRHVAKGIVDNAINHTLEEMGICPKSLTRTVQRRFVESNAITAAIRSEGLQFSNVSSPEPADNGHLYSEEDDDSIEQEFDNTCNLISTASQDTSRVSNCDSDLSDCFEQRQNSYMLDDAVSVAISTKGLMMRHT